MSTFLTDGRTHHCGELRADHANKDALLMGWIQRRRDFGALIILTLRDRDGETQLTVDEEHCSEETYKLATTLRIGACVGVKGKVYTRTARGGETNPNMPTGEVELVISKLELFSRSEPLPFQPEDETDAGELLRLKHRYIDLRRTPMYQNMKLRSDVAHETRDYFHKNGFLEIETPILMKSTPEGARDFLVPSRLVRGEFYALPQSPQIYKQILMMGGMGSYYQLSRCFRDEDLRADRQPEFTQIDFEMSFASREGIFSFVEGLFQAIFKNTLGDTLEETFPRYTYQEVMDRYGEDKPDIRYDLPLTKLNEVLQNTEFKVFQGVLEADGLIKGIKVPGKGRSNGWVKKLEALVKTRGAGGLARMRWENGAWNSPIRKFLSDSEAQALADIFDVQEDDLILIVADKRPATTNQALSTLRRHLALEFDLIPKENVWKFLWVTDFPYVEYDEEDERYYAVSHPFTRPHPDDMHWLDKDPSKMRSLSYDLVLNGFELGSGSLRIHDTELQMQMLKLLGFKEEDARAQFGFLLDALKFGPPPHGGAAFGLDRIVMLMAGEESLRDVIAFPKTQKASCPMSEAPSTVSTEQLQELHIALTDSKKTENID